MILAAGLTVGFGLFFENQSANACSPGEVYVEGTKVWFACIGQNGGSCAKCVDVERIK